MLWMIPSNLFSWRATPQSVRPTLSWGASIVLLYGCPMMKGKTLLRSGYRCVNSFQKCAQRAYIMGVTRWKLMPKYHSFGEILFELEVRKRKSIPSINPLCWCTQQDEDFVGRIANMSRSVSIRTVHSRTIGRYLVALASKWWTCSKQVTQCRAHFLGPPSSSVQLAWQAGLGCHNYKW